MSWDDLVGTSEEEAQESRFSLLKEGEYYALIEKAEDTISKSSGNPMTKLQVTVFDHNDEGRNIDVYLVGTKKMVWKARHCAVSAGLEPEWENKLFKMYMLEGRRVKVKVAIQYGHRIPDNDLRGKAPGAMYPDKNIIEDFLPMDEKINKEPVAFNDDVPF